MTGLFHALINFFPYFSHKISMIDTRDCRDASHDLKLHSLIQQSARFSGYETSYSLDRNKVVLTGVGIRPANLFFQSLFRDSPIKTTQPGSGKLFAFNTEHQTIREYCRKMFMQHPDKCISFSANGQHGFVTTDGCSFREISDLCEIFGPNIYQITWREIWDTLNSQEIFLSPLLPLSFYQKLKSCMRLDHIVTLPGNDSNPVILKTLKKCQLYPHLREFCQLMEQQPEQLGLSVQQAEQLSKMTLYQIGSMVVKREDFRIFVDEKMKIRSRMPGQNDAIRLINACGIRGLSNTNPQWNRDIIKWMFKTALCAAEKGIALFPAVGMGVWKGDPDLYWRAFLDAIVESDIPLDAIFVNPGHQKSHDGKYAGYRGEEFEVILNEYKIRFKKDEKALFKLKKIQNLFAQQTDIVQFAHRLKTQYPDRIVSLLNASDPDVTLGFHVGEYVNNCPHCSTTEENYTAIGTNGLCFEDISGVHELNKITQTT